MPSISSCPACHRDLTIPDLTDGRKSLRCPLCDAQFAAEQVLADCVPFPPLAIVIEAAEWPPDAGVAEGPRYTPNEESDAISDAIWRESAQDPSGESRHNHPDVADAASTKWTTDDEEGATEAFGDGSADFQSQVSSMRVAPRVRHQTGALAMLGQFVGIGLGGFIGLAIGYWVLLWLGGTRSDFLELRAKLPRWLMPPARRHHADLPMPLAKQPLDQHEPDRDFFAVAAPTPAASEAPAEGIAAEEDDGMALQSLPTEADAPLSIVPDEAPLEPPRAALDASSPAPNMLPAGYVGPSEFHSRTADDLRAALEQTELALRCPRCQMPGAVRLVSFDSATDDRPDKVTSPACDVCRGKPMVHLGAAGFTQLCQLGEAVTFVRFGVDDDQREPLRDAAETLLMAIGNQRDKCETIGRLAGAWLADSGRQSNGIVVAGTVEDARAQGDLFVVRLMLLSCGKHVEVVSRQAPEPALARRDHVVMLGSIVDSPQDNLVGYAGEARQVIWGGLHLRVAD